MMMLMMMIMMMFFCQVESDARLALAW